MLQSSSLCLEYGGERFSLPDFTVQDSLHKLKSLVCETLCLEDAPPYHRLRLIWRSEALDDFTPWSLQAAHPLLVQIYWQPLSVEFRSSRLVPLLDTLTFFPGRALGNPLKRLRELLREISALAEAPDEVLRELLTELFERRYGPVDGLRLWAQLCDAAEEAALQCLTRALSFRDWAPFLIVHEQRFLQHWSNARLADVLDLLEQAPWVSSGALTKQWRRCPEIILKTLEKGYLQTFLASLTEDAAPVSQDMVLAAVSLDGEVLRCLPLRFHSNLQVFEEALLATEQPAQLFLDLAHDPEVFDEPRLQKAALRGTWDEELRGDARRLLAAELLKQSPSAKDNPEIVRLALPLVMHLAPLLSESVLETLPHLHEQVLRRPYFRQKDGELPSTHEIELS